MYQWFDLKVKTYTNVFEAMLSSGVCRVVGIVVVYSTGMLAVTGLKLGILLSKLYLAFVQ